MQRLIVEPEQIEQDRVCLTTEQEHYLRRVLRLKVGDRFILCDGRGHSWIGELLENRARMLFPTPGGREIQLALTLLIALPKGNAFDEVIRCCTELGVAQIVPVISDRTLLNPSDKKLDRWRRIAKEATEQSERQRVPPIQDPLRLQEAIASVSQPKRYFCVARRDVPHLLTCPCLGDVVVATGPEGGWTHEEMELAIASGFELVSLGRGILRAVTAAIAATTIVSAKVEANW